MELELMTTEDLVDELARRYENLLVVAATVRREDGPCDECFYMSRAKSDGSGLLEECVGDALKRYEIGAEND